eukprot:TRINITY_DN12355_c0_g1_i1.p1 TRINITY_DN12355_c0_g1~~TRINITY_DN12355_c0_g1_i1.p1  ORF type:complete len:1480 (+),score=289.63 TRINITY_DN12355_c0_g1_i1:71-4510(+)
MRSGIMAAGRPRNHRTDGLRRRYPLTNISALVLLSLSCLLLTLWHGASWHKASVETSGRLRQQDHAGSVRFVEGASPGEVLSESALTAFHEELPHWLHAAAAKALRPFVERLSDLGGTLGAPTRLAAMKRDLHRSSLHGKVVLVDDNDPGSAYRRWRRWLQEVCHVLGFAMPDQDRVWDDLPLCPELWVDEAWPPSTSSAPTVNGRAVPVWSVIPTSPSSSGGYTERGAMAMQGRLLRSFPEQQVKALMGYELGLAAYSLLAGRSLGEAWLGKLSKAYLGGQLLHEWRGGRGQPRHRAAGLQALLDWRRNGAFSLGAGLLKNPQPGLLEWARGAGNSYSGNQEGMAIPGLSSTSLAQPVAEWFALSAVLRRTVPWMLRPLVYGALIARGGPDALLAPLSQQVQGISVPGLAPRRARARRSLAPALLAGYSMTVVAPWLRLAVQAGGIRAAAIIAAACKRSEVLTADRAAALAAGDVAAAAAALLRVHGELPGELAEGEELEAAIEEASRAAQQRTWDYRRKALLLSWQQPAPEERVRELLRWGASGSGARLIALAEMRRSTWRSGVAWWYWLCPWVIDRDGLPSGWWYSWLGRALLLGLVVLPMLAPVDLVRWAAMCTLGVTGFGVMSPLCFGGAGLPLGLSAAMAILLVVYAAVAWLVWWNHLLGGSRRWAELSSRLTGQLADQADVTAGIAYLTRDWAEMARRSLAALDQELCGSWRTSLHELASKLTDLWSEMSSMPEHPGQVIARSKSLMLPSPVAKRQLCRSGTSPQGSSMHHDLWLKVDRAVQRALRVEVERMKKAAETDDPKALQAMTSWWSANNGAVAAAAAAVQPAEDLGETLGSLLLSEKLHQRFQYVSFSDSEDAHLSSDEQVPGAGEFKRLELALSTNFQCLQDLKGRLAPLATAAGTLRCLRWSDLRWAAAELSRHCHQCLASASEHLQNQKLGDLDIQADSAEDKAAERRILACLLSAACLGICGVPLAASARAWLWVLALVGFAAANIVLLLNYQRLSLPHVHRRFERRLEHLSEKREEILREIRDLQRSSQRAGAVHARASIFLQSVNVLRNINYVVLCIKTESQRSMASSTGPSPSQAKVVLGGLRLLLAVLPRCQQRWEAEILADRDCGSALTALSPARYLKVAHAQPLQRLVADSQKRLWIMFRMVHLSSCLPIEAHGQLCSLVERYVRPVLVEGRVPLRQNPSMELEGGQEATLQQAAGNGVSQGKGFLLAIGDSPGKSLTIADGRQSECKGARSDGSHGAEVPTSHREALKQLSATRRDLSKVLARLMPEALLESGQLAAHSEASRGLLQDLLTSVLVLLAPGASSGTGGSSWAFGGNRRPHRPAAGASPVARPAAAIGFRHGEQAYTLEGGVRTNILLRVATLRGPGTEVARTGSISDLRSGTPTAGVSRAEELELPLTALLDEAPGEEDTAELWAALGQAWPGWYGDNALQERRSALRRVTATARQLRRGKFEGPS